MSSTKDPSHAAGRPRAGPRTDAGKEVSRSNALRHGLSARTLLPSTVNTDRVGELREAFAKEFGSASVTAYVLLCELARHAALLELAEQAEQAVIRHGAVELSAVVLNDAQSLDEQQDAVLASTMATDGLERLTRYRRCHEKGFHSALSKLTELRNAAGKGPASADEEPSQPIFQHERECEEFLRQRFAHDDWTCPHCGHSSGSWLQARRRWECGGCHRQIGLRSGTVMERSALPLLVWCRAILLLAGRPQATGHELAKATGTARRATLSRLSAKILAALASSDKSKLLAGIDALAQHRRST